MRIKLGSVAYLRAADSGYGIGLDDEGHRVEFLGNRHVLALATVGEAIEVQDWRCCDDELRLPLTRLAMAQRTAFRPTPVGSLLAGDQDGSRRQPARRELAGERLGQPLRQGEVISRRRWLRAVALRVGPALSLGSDHLSIGSVGRLSRW